MDTTLSFAVKPVIRAVDYHASPQNRASYEQRCKNAAQRSQQAAFRHRHHIKACIEGLQGTRLR